MCAAILEGMTIDGEGKRNDREIKGLEIGRDGRGRQEGELDGGRRREEERNWGG